MHPMLKVFFVQLVRNEWILLFIALCVSGSAQMLHAAKEAAVRLKTVRNILWLQSTGMHKP